MYWALFRGLIHWNLYKKDYHLGIDVLGLIHYPWEICAKAYNIMLTLTQPCTSIG